MTRLVLLFSIMVLVISIVSYGQVPNKISYQGLLTTSAGTPVIDGSYNLQFDIYNLPVGGSLKYTETQTDIPVSKGTFSVILHPTSTIFAESLFVEVTALAGPSISVSATFSPRSELTSSPYSLAPWTTSGSNIYYNSGNVGIGTISTLFGARLEVVDRLNVVGTGTSRVFIAKDGDEYLDLSYDALGAKGKISTYNSSQPLILQQTGGNVGIGTTSPGEQLEITGNLRVPATTATTGIMKVGVDRFIHSYGTGNTFVGRNAGNLTMTGNNNTASGYQAFFSNTTGFSNVAVGSRALYANTSGSNLVAVGDSALQVNSTAQDNTAIGSRALRSNTTGSENTAVGSEALYFNAAGGGNTAVGSGALSSQTTAYSNTAVGAEALSANTTAGENTATGAGALATNSTGTSNTATGSAALNANSTGSYNTAAGQAALLKNTTASNNTALGAWALFENRTGTNNTANGRNALLWNNTGSRNSAYGVDALGSNETGNGNTAMGDSALFSNVTGNFNTAVGYWANVSTGALTNATALGYNATVNASNKVRIGNGAVTVIEGQVAWSWPSDVRVKKEIKESDLGMEFINKLRPVSFKMKNATDDNLNYGFIAQEVEKVLDGKKTNMVLTGDDAEKMKTMRYTELIAPLVKAMQEQQKIIDGLTKRIEELEKEEIKELKN